MDDKAFEKIVKEAVEAIPEKFLGKLSNIDICIEETPSPYQLGRLKSRKNFKLFGLYEGVPQTERRHYGEILPDKITVFKNPILERANSIKEVKEIVRDTVWHEIAHHFGMSEERVRKAEKRKKKKN